MRTAPTGFDADSLNPFVAIDLAFDSGDVRLWNGYGEITIDSQVYTGAGSLLAISSVEETGEIAARGVTMTLTGISSDIISIALSENYQNRTAKVFIGSLSDSGTVSA